MTNKALITSNFNIETAKAFVASFDTNSHDSYYVFLGKHLPVVNNITESQSEYIDIYNNIVFSKKIQKTDVVHMTRNIPWKENKKYDIYDDKDIDLKNKDFFTIVDDEGEYNVYKCLDNANTVSLVPPSRAGNSMDNFPHITSDGYIWKYLYTIDKITYDKFTTRDFIPVNSNTSIIDNSINGTVNKIKILDSGKNYNNYIVNGNFSAGDLSIGGDNTIFGAPITASNINDYYKGCVLRIKTGTGIDQYRRIIGYEGSSIQKKYHLDKAFDIQPLSNDSYEVYPYVYVWGDGSETIAAEGLAYIEPTANSVSSVYILNTGKDYRDGMATIGASPRILFDNSETNSNITLPSVITQDANFTQALLEPIISPRDGHGGNPIKELFANKVCIGIRYNQTESGTIPLENDFRQIGIIKNPLFDNVTIFHDEISKIGSFSINEDLVQFKQIKINGTFTINSNTNIIEKLDQGKLFTQATILNGGLGYDGSANNQLVFNNSGTGGSGAAGTFTNNANGTIISATISNTGIGYISAPTISINPTAAVGGSFGQIVIGLANEDKPLLKDSFSSGESVLITSNSNSFIGKIDTIPEDFRIILNSNSSFTSNNVTLSKIQPSGKGKIVSLSGGRLTLTNVSGIFEDDSRILGLNTAAISIIKTSNSTFNAVTLNDKSDKSFITPVQLTRLEGNFTSGSLPFIEDETVVQESNIVESQPSGKLHHSEINAGTDDDILYITGTRGIFDFNSLNSRAVKGLSSLATFDNINNKYTGDFVKDSGQILYYENVDPIRRSGSKSEVIKITIAL